MDTYEYKTITVKQRAWFGIFTTRKVPDLDQALNHEGATGGNSRTLRTDSRVPARSSR